MEIDVVPIEKVHEAEDKYDIRYSETRYVIVSKETGEILDDAQGYGYKTKQKAHAAWAYKHRDRAKEAEKKKLYKEIKQWLKENQLKNLLEQIAFEIAKGSWGPEDKFNAKLVTEILKEKGFEDCPYKSGDIVKAMRY